MNDADKTKAQLIQELAETRQSVAELEAPLAARGQPEQVARTAIEQASAEAIPQAPREYAESIVDTVREPLLVLDAELRVVAASRSFCRDFHVTPEETQGQLLYSFPDAGAISF